MATKQTTRMRAVFWLFLIALISSTINLFRHPSRLGCGLSWRYQVTNTLVRNDHDYHIRVLKRSAS